MAVITLAIQPLAKLWMTDAVDLQGLPRILFGGHSRMVDMGAYETLPLQGSVMRFR